MDISRLSPDALTAYMAERARPGISSLVRDERTRHVNAGARRMLREPWRIEQALYPLHLGPIPTEASALLLVAGNRLRLIASGHWSANGLSRVAINQARLALRYRRRFDRVELAEAA